ncbi:MAG: ABC transporter ATP-binding protein [Acidimicrobiia bacterium]|nr:ABC transporter ATP-binding protein [Acidimicrobiia bacterium]
MSEQALYELHDVSRVFRRGPAEVRAVDDVDLVVGPGEFVAVEGPSGSGKSTLLQLRGALDRPTSGSVQFDGRALEAMTDRELTRLRRDGIGFVFQQFNLIPTLTAAENVEAALAPTGVGHEARRARSDEVLGLVGLAERRDHLPSRLSGGEQQRVAIARALANGPRVILADEPTGNLDSRTAADVVGLLGQLCDDEGVTVVLVTHDENVARRARRRIAMADGHVEVKSPFASRKQRTTRAERPLRARPLRPR